jgi:hypothetical protein
MNGVDPSVGMLAHIRHAEGWLRRARADYLRGNGPQVLLRLLLAEAEIRRARESAVGTAAAPPRRSPASLWTILGTVALAGALLVVYTVIRPPVPSPAARVSAASHTIPIGGRGGVLRFESGQVLPFVGVPAGIRPGGWTGPGNAVGIDANPLLTNDEGPTPVTFH